jgi:hypothetical protein
LFVTEEVEMSWHGKLTVFVLILIVLILSACGPNGELSLEDLEEGELEFPEEVVDVTYGGDGGGTIYYHYHLNNPVMIFKLDPVIGISFAQEEDSGTVEVSGIGQTTVNLWMLAGGTDQGTCEVECEMKVNYAATGTLEVGSSGACELHMAFLLSGVEDESILTGTCPIEYMTGFSCAAMSAVMVDPSLYVFSSSNPNPRIPTDSTVTLKAELRGLELPEDARGLCSW